MEFKEFCDPVHGDIVLSAPLVAIVDTPQFQRLRYVKQLGLTYFVYFGAVHSRFEHCIGTCHLAGRLIRSLKNNQPELDITDKEILCIEIAALCHDLGHGPFSHSFERFVEIAHGKRDWEHEDASIAMFDEIISSKSTRQILTSAGLEEDCFDLIKELIVGKPDSKRSLARRFLFEIVANKRNGIDVDKFDYFKRDCHHCGLKYAFDHERVFNNTKVLFADGTSYICFRDKVVSCIADMYQFRYSLHRDAYQHRTVRLFEHMMTEVLLKADSYLTFVGKEGKKLKLSDCVHDMVAFVQLRDSVIDRIRWSDDERLLEAKQLLEAIERRELYVRIGEIQMEKDQEEVLQEFIAEKCDTDLDDIVLIPMEFSYGQKMNNPLEHVLFYNKGAAVPQKLSKEMSIMYPSFQPTNYTYRKVVVYLKKRDNPQMAQAALDAFNEWCRDSKLRGRENLDFTPHKVNSIESMTFSPSSISATECSPRKTRRRLPIDEERLSQ